CPIDKNFPLNLYIFSYETSSEKIRSILEIPKNSNANKLKSENIVILSHENGKISVQDDLILERTPLVAYLNLIKSSVEELENIEDLSGIESSKMLLEKIRTEIYTKLKKCISNLPKNDLDEILPELVMINKFKFEIEIETGILFCPKCKRWFPIIDTIPQMLPDEYRDEQVEIEFLKTNKNLLHNGFFQQDLKPFNI
ncbi:MAG: Trm112 family protein, partial [Candidatus Lokiarchaeota archaeon]